MKNAQEAQIIKKITDKFDDVIIKVSFMTKNPHRLKKGICSAYNQWMIDVQNKLIKKCL